MIDYGDTAFAVERLRMKRQHRRNGSGTTANGSPYARTAVTASQAMVLVIDDSDAMVEVLTDMLQQLNCKVISAFNGRDGVAAYDQNQDEVALIILDMNMPLMSGEEALAKLRQLNPSVPVIVSSSISEAEARRRCLNYGQEISYFLAKPYRYEQARQMIGEIMGH